MKYQTAEIVKVKFYEEEGYVYCNTLTRFQKDEQPSSQKEDNCPHQAIIDLYHEILPEGLRVKTWKAPRQRLLRARWNESTLHQSLEFWKSYFTQIKTSDFLTGRNGSYFIVSLEWLIRPTNFANVVEGKYHYGRKKQ